MSVATNLLLFQVAMNGPRASHRKFGYPYAAPTAGKAIEAEQEPSLGEVVLLTLLGLWGAFMGVCVTAALIGNAS